MKSKSLIKLGLVGFLLFPRIARAEPKPNSLLKNFEFRIGPSYTVPFKKPGEDYYKQLNEDFRTGKYTFTTPIPQWKNIKTPKSNEFGVEGSLLYRLKKSGKINPRVGVFVGYGGSSSKSNYNENYDIWDAKYKGGKYIPTNFKRQENISTSTVSLGAIGKVSLTDRLDVSAKVGHEFRKVKGNVDYTLDRLDNPYVQWRKADYSGSGTGFSVEGGLDCKILGNISFGVAGGYRTGKVQTKGKEVKTAISNPGMSWTYDYSPEFNFNSTYGKVGVEVKF